MELLRGDAKQILHAILSAYFHFLFQGATTEVLALARSENRAADERKNQGRREKLLRGGGCRFCRDFRRVDNDCLLAAFGGSGVDGIQVNALRSELVQNLRQRTGPVGQIVGFRRSFLIGDPGVIEGFLRAPGIFGDELNDSSRALGGSQERENIHLGVAEGFRDTGDRAGLIVNRDCELLGLGHVSTSWRAGGRLYAWMGQAAEESCMMQGWEREPFRQGRNFRSTRCARSPARRGQAG